MSRARGGLGRGLESLFEDAAPSLDSADSGIRTVPLREIEPDPGQPRKTFREEGLSELANSISQHGLLQPIAVRPSPWAGTGLWRASAGGGPAAGGPHQSAGDCPGCVGPGGHGTGSDRKPPAGGPGPHRRGLRHPRTDGPVPADPGGGSPPAGKSRSALANSLRLLNLPPEALELLKSGKLTAGHAKAILGLPSPELQVQAARLIAEHNLNVRQAEELCRRLAKEAKPAGIQEEAPRPTLPVEVEESLRQTLGNEVSVAYKDGKGSLTVHFYSDDQLRAFANLLGHYNQEGSSL